MSCDCKENNIEYSQETYKRKLIIEVGETETNRLVAALKAEEILCEIFDFQQRLRSLVKYDENVPKIVDDLCEEFCKKFGKYLELIE